MILVTVPKNCAPQTIKPIAGERKLGPGEGFAGEFPEAEIATMKASPGHYVLSEPVNETSTAPKPVQHRRGRGRH